MKKIIRAVGITALLMATTGLTAPAYAAISAVEASTQADVLSPAVEGLTAPKDFFPVEPGTDYYLANYDQYAAYLQRLASESDRIKVQSFGTTEEGRTQWMGIVSSPANLANLDRYQEIARKLAKAEGVTEEEARALAAEGKAVVWIDAGLHATETVTVQGQIHVLYRLLSGQDAETLRTLDDTILLFGHANPDGHQLVADWYMRKENPQDRSFRDIPRCTRNIPATITTAIHTWRRKPRPRTSTASIIASGSRRSSIISIRRARAVWWSISRPSATRITIT